VQKKNHVQKKEKRKMKNYWLKTKWLNKGMYILSPGQRIVYRNLDAGSSIRS